MQISDDEKAELLRLASSSSLKRDLQILKNTRHNPLVCNGIIDADRALEFLTQFNEFINHQSKPFKKINDRDMRL